MLGAATSEAPSEVRLLCRILLLLTLPAAVSELKLPRESSRQTACRPVHPAHLFLIALIPDMWIE